MSNLTLMVTIVVCAMIFIYLITSESQKGWFEDLFSTIKAIRYKEPIEYTSDMAGSGQHGICAKCKKGPTPEGHDGCLGTLPGDVKNACCGHGNPNAAYIQFDHCDYKKDPNKNHISGVVAHQLQKDLIVVRDSGTKFGIKIKDGKIVYLVEDF